MDKNKPEGQRAAHELATYFESHLFEHLSKKRSAESAENHPEKIIKEAKGAVGKLSRIFEQFNFPVLSYKKIKTINENPDGLREHMEEVLNEVLPVILNQDKNALDSKLINAINANGESNYNDILKGTDNDQKEIADQFVKAIILAYSQKVLDNIKSEKKPSEQSETEANAEIIMPLGNLADKADVNGLPAQSNMEPADLQKIINKFLTLLDEAVDQNILDEEKIKPIYDPLNKANSYLEAYEVSPSSTWKGRAVNEYDKAVNSFIDIALKKHTKKPVKPKEANWLKKILRFITNNAKLFQTLDEKRYEKQSTLLKNLDDLGSEIDKSSKQESKDDLKQDQSPTLKQ